MNIEFEIEDIFEMEETTKVCVFARLLNTKLEWQLSDESAIGEVKIEKWCDSPRTFNNDGDIRLDLFAFVLKNKNDKARLKINQIAELTP